jgi:hypothetical protein
LLIAPVVWSLLTEFIHHSLLAQRVARHSSLSPFC